jgi:choline kinase
MNIIITIAGASRRFSDAGIDIPKWALPFKGRNILFEVVNGLSTINADKPKIFLFCLEKQRQLVEKCLMDFSNDFQISISTTQELTKGQAFSAASCILSNGLEEEQVLIAPGDMIFRNLEKYKFKTNQNWNALANQT